MPRFPFLLLLLRTSDRSKWASPLLFLPGGITLETAPIAGKTGERRAERGQEGGEERKGTGSTHYYLNVSFPFARGGRVPKKLGTILQRCAPLLLRTSWV